MVWTKLYVNKNIITKHGNVTTKINSRDLLL